MSTMAFGRTGRAAIVLAGLVVLGTQAFARRDAPGDEDAARALASEIAALRALVDLAGGDDFYLVLDPGAGTLRLMLKGAELQRYRVLDVQVGLPKIAHVGRPATRAWQGEAWAGGELDPPREIDRVRIQPPSPGSEEEREPVIPQTPDEAYPAPLRYHVSFPGGPSLEVRPTDADEDANLLSRAAAWSVSRWGNFWAALTTPADERVRLRLVLSPEDAGSLFRALPPRVGLVVI